MRNFHASAMTENKLVDAAAAGDTESVRRELIKGASGIDPRVLLKALKIAAFKGHIDVIKILLDNGANINGRDENGDGPLDGAIEAVSIDAVKYLLRNGADVNGCSEHDGVTPLHRAIDAECELAKHNYDQGDVDAIPAMQVSNLLVEAGADVNARTVAGETPLRWAVNGWHKKVEDLLLSKGAQL